jgi:deoxyribodipyrimidine photo-lyase
MTDAPLLLWFRRDLRLADHPMLTAAVASGRPLIPLFILDPETQAQGAAPRWRLEQAVAAFAAALERLGSRLILRRGPALAVLQALAAETGAAGVHWTRLYDSAAKARDSAVKAALKAQGLQAASHPGHLLFEPWEVETGTGGFYRVYSPFWRAVEGRAVPAPHPAPRALRAPAAWPASDRLADWRMAADMRRGAAVLSRHACVGEAAAAERLHRFLAAPVDGYKTRRDFVAEAATSRLSENLTYGEIGPRTVWHGAVRAREGGARGAEHFQKELAWREFAYHLIHHTPEIETRNWRAEWDSFPWRPDNPEAEAWRQGMTGEPFVDAALREMYVTGTMHNRARMVVASYLTKHLMTHWQVGLSWFADCLTDWDPASNAMGWQWTAGSGPDAAPYFRVFNPAAQAEKFDPDAAYRQRWVAELTRRPAADGLDYFDAVPRSWRLDPARPYPRPIVDLSAGRERALAAYAARGA